MESIDVSNEIINSIFIFHITSSKHKKTQNRIDPRLVFNVYEWEFVSFIVTELFSYDMSYSSDGFNRMELDKYVAHIPVRPNLKFIST